MKYIFLVLLISSALFGGVLKSKIVTINEDETKATITIDKIDIGVSGFIVHTIKGSRTIILKNAVVISYDKDSKIADLELSEYNALRNSALPSGRWHVKVGDEAVLAFGYTRGLLIAPSEEIYYRITRHSQVQWIHPDIFATILSFNGHPTPLREDFTKISIASSVGLVYIFLDKKLYTVDAKSFKILTIIEADLLQDESNLPFYTRIPEIDANWFGAGSSKLDNYEAHYYELLAQANPKNKNLYKIVKAMDKQARIDEDSDKEEFEDLDGDRFEDALEKFILQKDEK
jgi:hypothetical protein